MKTKTCVICGKTYVPRFPNSKYCCLKCRDAGRIQKRTKWLQINQNYYQTYYQRAKEKHGSEQ